ncbi:SWI complex [Fragilaria crotonensis]|nr:SWI complex [Fragilaria crotonensis]
MAEPTDDELRLMIRKVVATVDLDSTGMKKFTKLLSKQCGGVDLSHKSKFIKKTLTDVINEGTDDSDGSDDEDEDEEEEETVDRKASIKKKAAGGKKSGGGGLSAVKEISNELAEFLGKGKRMARTEIVKMLWEYIRENDLQNPENKREIILDDKLRRVFGKNVKSFTMFTMNKYVSAHVEPFKPVDLTTNTTVPKKRKSKATDKKEKKKSKSGSGFQVPYQLSPELARVTGKQILPRPQVVKKLWEYIRANDLQDPSDKRTVVCDAKLKLVMGGKAKVTIFSMQKFISEHLLEKLDPSYYTPSDVDGEQSEDEDEE